MTRRAQKPAPPCARCLELAAEARGGEQKAKRLADQDGARGAGGGDYAYRHGVLGAVLESLAEKLEAHAQEHGRG